MGCHTGPPQSSPTEYKHLSWPPRPRGVNPTRVHTPSARRRGLCWLLNSKGTVKSVAKHGCLVPCLAHTSTRQPLLGPRAVFALGVRPRVEMLRAVAAACAARAAQRSSEENLARLSAPKGKNALARSDRNCKVRSEDYKIPKHRNWAVQTSPLSVLLLILGSQKHGCEKDMGHTGV